MSTSHSGNCQPEIDREEHVGLAAAKRTAVVIQDANGNWIQVTGLDLANGNPMGVAILSGSTGSPITVGRNPGRLAGPGALSSSYQTIYTSSAPTIANMRLYNSGGSTRVVTVSIKNASGDSDTVIDTSTLYSGYSLDITDIDLSSGNLIRVKQDAGTDVNYYLDGESIS